MKRSFFVLPLLLLFVFCFSARQLSAIELGDTKENYEAGILVCLSINGETPTKKLLDEAGVDILISMLRYSSSKWVTWSVKMTEGEQDVYPVYTMAHYNVRVKGKMGTSERKSIYIKNDPRRAAVIFDFRNVASNNRLKVSAKGSDGKAPLNMIVTLKENGKEIGKIGPTKAQCPFGGLKRSTSKAPVKYTLIINPDKQYKAISDYGPIEFDGYWGNKELVITCQKKTAEEMKVYEEQSVKKEGLIQPDSSAAGSVTGDDKLKRHEFEEPIQYNPSR